VIFKFDIFTDNTSSDFSNINALDIKGIRVDEVGDLFLTTSLKQGLEDEDVHFPIAPPSMCKTKKKS